MSQPAPPKSFSPEHEAHNVSAIAACRAQLEAGEISADDFEWLTGEPAPNRLYLVPDRPSLSAHLLGDSSALCRGYRGGKYRIEPTPMGRAVCQMCLSRMGEGETL